MSPLSKEELIRYSRQLIVPGFGTEGQQKLKSAKVAVIGLGGLGSAVLNYLAGAGVGELGLADMGEVELSNLHRQFIYGSGDIGGSKTALAAAHIKKLNPAVKTSVYQGELNFANMKDFLAGYDFAVDCTDNFRTRAAVNKACLELKKTYVFGAVFQFEGQAAVFEPNAGPCFDCLCPDAALREDRRCEEEGVAGPAAGAVAAIQAAETIKLILGLETLKGRMVLLDLRTPAFHVIQLKKYRDCGVCGTRRAAEKRFLEKIAVDFIAPEELKAGLAGPNCPRVLDLRFDWERELCRIEGDEWADMDRLPEWAARLEPGAELVLYCKNQSKSIAVWRKLKALGFKKIFVLAGGITLWAEKIDPKMTRY